MFFLKLCLKYRVCQKVTNRVGVGLHIVQNLDAGYLVVRVHTHQHRDRRAETTLFRWHIGSQKHKTNQFRCTRIGIVAIASVDWRFTFLFGKAVRIRHHLCEPFRLHIGGKGRAHRIAFNGLARWLRMGERGTDQEGQGGQNQTEPVRKHG